MMRRSLLNKNGNNNSSSRRTISHQQHHRTDNRGKTRNPLDTSLTGLLRFLGSIAAAGTIAVAAAISNFAVASALAFVGGARPRQQLVRRLSASSWGGGSKRNVSGHSILRGRVTASADSASAATRRSSGTVVEMTASSTGAEEEGARTTTDDSAGARNRRIPRRNVVEAVLWDMDGTLLDTETLSDRAILNILAPRSPNGEVVASVPWEIKKPTLGLRGPDWIPMVLNYARDKWGVPAEELPTVDDFWQKWEAGLNDLAAKQVEALPGAAELVSEFEKAGIRQAIATSSRMSAVSCKRKRHESTIFAKMECVVSGDDPAVVDGKPAPDIYLEAARRLGVDPSRCLVMEDALAGVQSGKAAGCAVACAPDARYTDDERERIFVHGAGADACLRSWHEFDGSQFGLPSGIADAPSSSTTPERGDLPN